MIERKMAGLSGQEFADEVLTAARSEITDSCCTVLQLWADMWDAGEKEKRILILKTHLTDVLKDALSSVIEKETEVKENYAQRAEQLIEEIEELKVQLNVSIHYEDVEQLPLHCMAKALNEKAARYRQVKEDRLERLGELRALEEGLLQSLGIGVGSIGELPPVPTEAQLDELAESVQKLQEEKSVRTTFFEDKRKQIIELYSELGESPQLNFELDVVLEERVHLFQITEENMAKLNDLLVRLTAQLNEAKEKRRNMIERLRSLWTYLEEPCEKQNEVLRNNPGCTYRDFKGLQTELERCNRERAKNIGKFVEKMRKELEVEWDRCLVGPKTRKDFTAYNSTSYCEDLLQLHEIELARWKLFYSSNQAIYELYENHKSLFNKLVDLNGLGRNTNRYQNRGGQLLQEERQRKAVAKDLPRVEEELKAALTHYENKNGKPFYCFDEPLAQALDKEWASHFDQRIIDKFRGGEKKIPRTPLAVKRPATASNTPGGKIIKLQTRSEHRPVHKQNRNPGEDTFCLEPTYEEFQKTLNRKMDFTSSKSVSRSTEVLSLRKDNKETQKMKSTPNIATTKWTEPKAAPRTVPRAAKNGTPRRPQTRSRMPLIL